jgi:large subunit ribosomal protein L6
MSRVGNKVIPLPSGTSVDVGGQSVSVKGTKGELTTKIVAHTSISVADGIVTVARANETREARANHGLMRSLVANMVEGVSTGFEKNLEVIGIGYRADVKGNKLVLNLGYSHLINYPIPSDLVITAGKDHKVCIKGIDKQRVGQVAAEIRDLRRPDHYKGKGVRYAGEHIRIKQGKTA